MPSNVQARETFYSNKNAFKNELKLYINQRLFEKNIISEDMYLSAKDMLIKY